jgi:hypothetical protein
MKASGICVPSPIILVELVENTKEVDILADATPDT